MSFKFWEGTQGDRKLHSDISAILDLEFFIIMILAILEKELIVDV